MLDLASNVRFVNVVSPQAVTTTTTITSKIVDAGGYDSCAFVLSTGAITGSSLTITPTIYEGDADDMSDEAAAPDANLVGTEDAIAFTETSDNKSAKIGYIGDKRYTRMKIALEGTITECNLSVLTALGDPRVAPKSTQVVNQPAS